ncbi:MAG: NTP transferase domain-containing protein, partial [Longimicrobiales bacterium]|nr:NTP transferase domain-containing protein [Longimicrobiales bacterium]
MTRVRGVILAGGAGRRMGVAKEGVAVPGGTLLTRAWDALAPLDARPVLQGASRAPHGLEPRPDGRPGEGPLAGMETALRAAAGERGGAEGVAFLPLDLPRVTAPVVLALVERWRGLPEPGGCAVVVETRRGIQPLAGVYGTGLANGLSTW